jgi:hypothetical protein
MNLYLISQTVNRGYDTFNSAVVVAEDITAAQRIHPSTQIKMVLHDNAWYSEESVQYDWTDEWDRDRSWADEPAQVNVVFIGTARKGMEAGMVVCASFRAG